MALDGSSPSASSRNINKINGPVLQEQQPYYFDLAAPVLIASGFHAGTLDGELTGLTSLEGVGIVPAGLYGVADATLTFYLASRTFDYSAAGLSEIGYTEKGEFRLGDDVSADTDGVITGTKYLRYRPSEGIEVYGGNITVADGYVWTGSGVPGVGTGCGIVGAGFYAGVGAVITAQISSTDGTFQFGVTDHNISFDGTNVILVGSNLTVSGDNYIWVGDTATSDGVGIVSAGIVGVNSGTTHFAISSVDGAFAIGDDVAEFTPGSTSQYIMYKPSLSQLLLNNVSIALTSGGYLWTGTNTVGGATGLGIVSDVDGILDGLVAFKDGVETLFISSTTGGFRFGVLTGAYINYAPVDGDLDLVGTNITVSDGYVWVGTGDAGVSTGCGLTNAGFIAGVDTDVTSFISATDGSFQFGPDGKCLTYDGTDLALTGINLTISGSNYAWVGTLPIASGTGCGFTSSGIYGCVSGTQTVLINASTGDFTFGKASGNNLSYVQSTGILTLNGLNITDWANISGTSIPAPSATVGAIAGTNLYDSDTTVLTDGQVITAQGGVNAYDEVVFPNVDGLPNNIDCHVTTITSGGWYKIAEVSFDRQYGAFSWDGLFSWGANSGRYTSQARVTFGATSGASPFNVSTPYFRYSGDDLTDELKINYTGNTISCYVYLTDYKSCLFHGAWTVRLTSAANSWINSYQVEADSVSAPTGTNVAPTINYDLGATVGSDYDVDLNNIPGIFPSSSSDDTISAFHLGDSCYIDNVLYVGNYSTNIEINKNSGDPYIKSSSYGTGDEGYGWKIQYDGHAYFNTIESVGSYLGMSSTYFWTYNTYALLEGITEATVYSAANAWLIANTGIVEIRAGDHIYLKGDAKIGSASTDTLGFFGATGVDRENVDADGGMTWNGAETIAGNRNDIDQVATILIDLLSALDSYNLVRST